LSAATADSLAVDAQCVHHLGGGAVVLGAFRPEQRVVDERAMAVLKTGSAVSAPTHGLFVAPRGDNLGLARLRPAEFMQAVVVDAEVVGDLMDDRDRDLVDDLVLGIADVQQGFAVDRDGVR
jgi:hypothetical protein